MRAPASRSGVRFGHHQPGHEQVHAPMVPRLAAGGCEALYSRARGSGGTMHRFALVLLAACASAAPKPDSTGPETFQATLDSGSEVPSPIVSAQPSGRATFTVSGTTIAYKVNADGLSSAFT